MLGSKDQGGGVDGACVCHLLGDEQCVRVLVEKPEQNTAWKFILNDDIKMNFKER